MNPAQMTIGELADAAGVSRRAVRFYIHRGLLHPPTGLGRGSYYDQSHLDRLRRIGELQQAGHSLDAVDRILKGGAVPPPPAPAPAPRPSVRAELWSRIRLAEGIELHFDVTRHQPTAESVLAIRQALASAFGRHGTPAPHKKETP